MRIPLDRNSEVPLYQQIGAYLKKAITSGNLAAETRLPAYRQLAEDLGVNRTTVENAYTMLEADGLVFSRMGSGTYVFERVGTSQDLVRVTGTHNHIVYLTAFTTEVTRPSRGHDIVLGESPSGRPRPIKAWFPEGALIGRGFVYR
jgi:DNA-binding transcriptional regulator YhcF (GntR family)